MARWSTWRGPPDASRRPACRVRVGRGRWTDGRGGGGGPPGSSSGWDATTRAPAIWARRAASPGSADAERLAAKVADMRVFADADGRSNLSLLDTGGAALVISEFTLYADCHRARRWSFRGAADPAPAEALVESSAWPWSARACAQPPDVSGRHDGVAGQRRPVHHPSTPSRSQPPGTGEAPPLVHKPPLVTLSEKTDMHLPDYHTPPPFRPRHGTNRQQDHRRSRPKPEGLSAIGIADPSAAAARARRRALYGHVRSGRLRGLRRGGSAQGSLPRLRSLGWRPTTRPDGHRR